MKPDSVLKRPQIKLRLRSNLRIQREIYSNLLHVRRNIITNVLMHSALWIYLQRIAPIKLGWDLLESDYRFLLFVSFIVSVSFEDPIAISDFTMAEPYQRPPKFCRHCGAPLGNLCPCTSPIQMSDIQEPPPTYNGPASHATSERSCAATDRMHPTRAEMHAMDERLNAASRVLQLTTSSQQQDDWRHRMYPAATKDYVRFAERSRCQRLGSPFLHPVPWWSTNQPERYPAFVHRSLDLPVQPHPPLVPIEPPPPMPERRSPPPGRIMVTFYPIPPFERRKPRLLYLGTFLYNAAALTLHYFILCKIYSLLAAEDSSNGKLVFHYITFLTQALVTTYVAFMNAFPGRRTVTLFSHVGWMGFVAESIACCVFPDDLDTGVYLGLHVLLAITAIGGLVLCMYFKKWMIKWEIVRSRESIA